MSDINKKLAKAMGQEYEELVFVFGGKTILRASGRIFDYRAPAIFTENIIWLLDNGWCLGKTNDEYSVWYDFATDGHFNIHDYLDKSIFKCVALARIAACE